MSRTFYLEGAITGHASPRWVHPGHEDKDNLNMELSVKRADEVKTFLDEYILRKMNDIGEDISIALENTNERLPGDLISPATGIGDNQTLEEADGNEEANDPQLRRVNINMNLVHQIDGEAGFSFSQEIPEECLSQASDEWAVKVVLSGGVHFDVGGAVALIKLKNRKTGVVAQGFFSGGGFGAGVQTPAADPGWGDWVPFKTNRLVTFHDFHNTFTRLTMAGAGVGIVGYAFTFLSFPCFGVHSLSVGGFNMGGIGIDGSFNFGVYTIIPPIPADEKCKPAEPAEAHGSERFSYEVFDNLKHVVLFETGEHTISDEELLKIEAFADTIIDQITIGDTE